jgi:hypothetical protein
MGVTFMEAIANSDCEVTTCEETAVKVILFPMVKEQRNGFMVSSVCEAHNHKLAKALQLLSSLLPVPFQALDVLGTLRDAGLDLDTKWIKEEDVGPDLFAVLDDNVANGTHEDWVKHALQHGETIECDCHWERYQDHNESLQGFVNCGHLEWQ